jgi:signal transduction histidine kinase
LSAFPTARIDLDGLPRHERFTPAVEAAVYFCCLEALQNCAKYAPGANVRVLLARSRHASLMFTVTDDGPGFDPATVHGGSGHQHMADRMAALEGTINVRSAPGQGTTVTGCVPVRGREEGRTLGESALRESAEGVLN